MSQLVNAEVKSGNCTINAVLASNYATPKDSWVHVGMKCDLKGMKHGLHCVCWLAQDSTRTTWGISPKNKNVRRLYTSAKCSLHYFF